LFPSLLIGLERGGQSGLELFVLADKSKSGVQVTKSSRQWGSDLESFTTKGKSKKGEESQRRSPVEAGKAAVCWCCVWMVEGGADGCLRPVLGTVGVGQWGPPREPFPEGDIGYQPRVGMGRSEDRGIGMKLTYIPVFDTYLKAVSLGPI
jgi:hypothetical protein